MYIVYGKTNCAACNSAKKLLETKGLEFEYVDSLASKDAMSLFKSNGWKSFPQILKDGEHIGGFEDLRKFLE